MAALTSNGTPGFAPKQATWGGMASPPSKLNANPTSGPAVFNTRALNNGASPAQAQVAGFRPAAASTAANPMGYAMKGGSEPGYGTPRAPIAAGMGGGSMGFNMPSTERKINAATDALSESEKSANIDLNERAAAFGGSNSGVQQQAARQIATDFAGLKNNAARDIQTADEETARKQALEQQSLELQRRGMDDANSRFQQELAFKREMANQSGGGSSGGGGSTGSSSQGFRVSKQPGAVTMAPPAPTVGFGPGMVAPQPLSGGGKNQVWLGGGQGFMDPNLVGSSADPRSTVDPWAAVRGTRGGQGPQVIGGGARPLVPDKSKRPVKPANGQTPGKQGGIPMLNPTIDNGAY